MVLRFRALAALAGTGLLAAVILLLEQAPARGESTSVSPRTAGHEGSALLAETPKKESGKTGATDEKKGTTSKKSGSGASKKTGSDDPAKSGEGETATPGDGASEKESPGGESKGKTKTTDLDEQYIRENLEKYLSPTKMQFKEDGRVQLIFNFGDKKEEHETIFTPKIASSQSSVFRWALEGEYILGPWGRSTDSESGGYRIEGVRISNSGMAHLNVWFKDDVEAEIAYAQSITSKPDQTIAVVFTNQSMKSLGSNFGSQCAVFEAGRLKQSKGEFEAVKNEAETRIKLIVKDGTFTACRDNKKRSSTTYPQKTYALGKVGFIWGGGVASFIHRLEITGKVDAKKMAAEMRKRRR